MVCIIVVNLSKQESVENHLELGQKYLTDLNYSGAVLEFKNAIAIDPNNTEARIQLAEAYYQSNDWEMSTKVIEDVINEETPNISLAEELIDLYIRTENQVGALGVIQDLIEYTDEDKYYEMKYEIVGAIQEKPHPHAVGTDFELNIENNKVMSKGSNVLGQLGTAIGLGDKTYQQESYRDAAFTLTPQKVFAVGRTAYVVDTDGKLWAAGENRWGQKGISYGTMLPESGWTLVEGGEGVASVAGTTGNTYILKKDGSLWYVGGTNRQKVERVREFSTVLDIFEHESVVYVYTMEGEVYTKDMRYDSMWKLLKQNVQTFDITEF